MLEKWKKPTLKKFLIFREMEISSHRLKKLLTFQEGIWKAWKSNKKNLLKLASYDVFSVFTTVKHRDLCHICFTNSLWSKCDIINFYNISRPYSVFYMTYLYKNRGFWEVLEPIRALWANINRYSYTINFHSKVCTKIYMRFKNCITLLRVT